MNATEVGRTTLELLEFLQPMKLDGAQKIAALKSAANLLENVMGVEASQQCLAASISQILNPQK